MSERDDEPGGAPDPDADPDRGWAADLSRAAAGLTVLWRDPAAADPAGMAGAARAFPVIGVALGVAAAAAYAIGDGLGFYGLGSAALALGLVAALTGARGEVGAAAFLARFVHGGDDRMAAQAGLILVVFGIALRVGLLAAVSFAGAAAAILVAAVAVSRIAMPLAVGWGGAPAGPAADDGAEAGFRRLWVVALVGLLLLILFLGLWGAIVSAILAVAAAITPVAAAGRTGAPGGNDLDRPALWAVQQAVEIAVLAGAVATL